MNEDELIKDFTELQIECSKLKELQESFDNIEYVYKAMLDFKENLKEVKQ